MKKSFIVCVFTGLLLNFTQTQAEVVRQDKIKKIEPPTPKNIQIPLHEFQRPFSKNVTTRSPRQGEVILTDKHNTQYYGFFTLGSQSQSFSAILDTGSSNIWIPEESCSSPACSEKNRFNPASSGSFYSYEQPLNIQYGTGSMRGYVGYDTVTMGDLSVYNQGIGLAIELASDFQDSPFDGIFGLAYQSIAADQVTPWMDNAVEQGVIPKAMFSFYLSNTPEKKTSRLIIGELDNSFYQGDITWQPLHSLSADDPTGLYYNITFDSIDTDGQNVPLTCQYEGNCKAIVDSGTSLIVGPESDINNLLATLDIKPDCSNLKQQPTLNFTIGGNKLTVPPEFYVVKQIDWQGNETCVAGLAPGNQDFWIFGDAFMRAFYVVFDKTDRRIGFAKLANELGSPEELRKYRAQPSGNLLNAR
ncbi:pepsin-like aspartyl protease [Endozoicomonas ascidiicola]|uniref:pepsin-like aspartyl protease n=1 Tax=Endozoicomonas ascidiicola TaxID=1698521 RepID=UPI00082ECE26|nr:pepsin-like aspartyl protease [Endozoicomonas ascidiicola]